MQNKKKKKNQNFSINKIGQLIEFYQRKKKNTIYHKFIYYAFFTSIIRSF